MKTLKLFLIAITIGLMTSCGPVRVMPSSYDINDYSYDFNVYNYNYIHYLYVNNPNFFYSRTYINEFGQVLFFYQHPYFLRYCNYRNITPNRIYYSQNPRTYRRVRPNNRVSNKNVSRGNTIVRRNAIGRRSVPTSTRRAAPNNRASNKNVARRNAPIQRPTARQSAPRPTRATPRPASRSNGTSRRGNN